MRYRKDRNEEIGAGSTVLSFAGAPLLYELGTKWLYSTSMDWAGKLVERITGVTLEEYMKKNIRAPLGITDITFWPDTNPTLKAGKADMTVRNTPEGEIVHDGGPQLYNGAEDCFGGHGPWASMPNYLKILQSTLQDDEKLLKKETSKIMFEPQLSVESREAMKQTWNIPAATKLFVGEFPQGIATDWGIEGLLLFQQLAIPLPTCSKARRSIHTFTFSRSLSTTATLCRSEVWGTY
jgi:CubicO group peptidase (beta-lactamase class C family)